MTEPVGGDIWKYPYLWVWQAELARVSGVHRVNLGHIEAGRRGASVETLKRLAEALGVTMDDLA